MKLYLIRHAEALVSSGSDAERRLSPSGQVQAHRLAYRLQEESVGVRVPVYHSGLLRARETAEILASDLHLVHVEAHSGLLPEDNPEILLAHIRMWTEDHVLVGHLPYMALLLQALSEETYSIRFDLATAVRLNREEENTWVVDRVLHP